MTEQPERHRLPPGQQLVAPNKWPLVGERRPGSASGLWQLSLCGRVNRKIELDLDELARCPTTKITTDIHCVTRWSKYDVTFSGVLLRDLIDQAGTTDDALFVSFVACSERNHSSSLPLNEALALGTLIALEVDGHSLDPDHGGPVRVVVPGKYFYKSVKWVQQIELLQEDRLGFWESESGYHNGADPWKEQRFIAASIDKRAAAKMIEAKDFSNQNLLSLDMSKRNLVDLVATNAQLRNANFSQCCLTSADFRNANLSNAKFRGADLQRTDFSGADLEGADFVMADLRGAKLRGCSLFGTTFCEVVSGHHGCSHGAKLDAPFKIDKSQFDSLTPQQRTYVSRFVE